MCDFLSFRIEQTTEGLVVKFSHSLNAHNEIPGDGYEAEWTSDSPDDLSVRVKPDESDNKQDILKWWVLTTYKTRSKLLQHALDSLDWSNSSLDLSRCDLSGITLPQSVGDSLDLSRCDLSGITLPQSVGDSLYLRGCDLSGITLPQSVGGWLYLSGCDLSGITLPQSVGGWLDLRGCENIPEEQVSGLAQAGTKIYR